MKTCKHESMKIVTRVEKYSAPGQGSLSFLRCTKCGEHFPISQQIKKNSEAFHGIHDRLNAINQNIGELVRRIK